MYCRRQIPVTRLAWGWIAWTSQAMTVASNFPSGEKKPLKISEI